MKPILIFPLIFLYGCSSAIFDPDPYNIPGIESYQKNFPPMDIEIKYSSEETIKKKCDPFVEPNMYGKKGKALACANTNFILNKCIIYIQENFQPWVMQHELAHCVGGNHKKTTN